MLNVSFFYEYKLYQKTIDELVLVATRTGVASSPRFNGFRFTNAQEHYDAIHELATEHYSGILSRSDDYSVVVASMNRV